MYALIKPFVDLCLLRASPQDLPASPVLLGISVLAYFVAGWLLSAAVYGPGVGLLQTLADISFLSAYTYLFLWLNSRVERFTQTLTALLGAGAIITVVAIPLSTSVSRAVGSGEPVNGAAGLGYLLLMGWLVVVYAHIYRHAFSKSWAMGLMFSFGYILLGSLVIELLLPTSSLS